MGFLSNESPLESKVEARAVKEAKRRGWRAFKIGISGWPDRLFLKSAIYVWIEFKRVGGKPPTILQLKRHAELRAEGAAVYVCNTWQAALAILLRHEHANYYPGAEDL